MKKVLSLLLVTCLLLSCSSIVLADGGHSTKVRYVGEGTSEWELDVPSQLAPGESGNVILTGTWDSLTTVNVTADSTVTLTNDVDESSKTLGINFDNISQVGNMDNAIEVAKPISVSEMSGGIFGTWEGIFNYYVKVEKESEIIEFTVDNEFYGSVTYTFNAEKDMTWRDWIDSEYNTAGFSIDGVLGDEMSEYICIEGATMVYDVGYVSADDIIREQEYDSFNYLEEQEQ